MTPTDRYALHRLPNAEILAETFNAMIGACKYPRGIAAWFERRGLIGLGLGWVPLRCRRIRYIMHRICAFSFTCLLMSCNRLGNVATEDVVYMLQGLDIATNIQLDRLVEASNFIDGHLG
jgi:hypothetical protein